VRYSGLKLAILTKHPSRYLSLLPSRTRNAVPSWHTDDVDDQQTIKLKVSVDIHYGTPGKWCWSLVVAEPNFTTPPSPRPLASLPIASPWLSQPSDH
jgi:hypothetical protein